MSPPLWAALAAVVLATVWLTRQRPRQPTIPSPRDTLLPHLSAEQAANLPYPPDLLPGARDVATPYGVMRVYEWGPETGDKVIFIHGDATPAPILGPIAHDLVEKGCRVMMFGRSIRLGGVSEGLRQRLIIFVICYEHHADYIWHQRPLGQRVFGHPTQRPP